VSSYDFVSAAALGGMPPPGPKVFFLDESSTSASFQIKLRLSRTQVRARLALRQPANSRKSLETQATRLALRKSRQICCVTSSLQLPRAQPHIALLELWKQEGVFAIPLLVIRD
jgi:hypothetical protein